MNIKISIVVPCYNSEAFIDETLASLKSQNYPNLELIIIDGGSTDSTLEIIKLYSDIVTVLISEKDAGQTEAINKGFQIATGDIFNWLNSDDILLDKALENVSNTFLKYNNIEVVCGKEYSFFTDCHTPVEYHHGSFVDNSSAYTFYKGIIDQPCTFFKRKVIEKYFPLSISLKYIMDRELWMSYLCENGVHRIRCVSYQFTAFRLHANSKTVLEGNYFDAEHYALKAKILKDLYAPKELIEYMEVRQNEIQYISDRFKNLSWKGLDKLELISIIAYEYALFNYVKNNYAEACKMMNYIIRDGKIKYHYLSLYIKVSLLPTSILLLLKNLKRNFENSFRHI